ncbi:NAD(P)-dependent oxidoreductase [Salinibacterium sp. M195]|uniref:NAD(P)-dependent oxidoreductase n=1 Tax=Salinibacterium sp. M195 TaxID=2583374 RepID=UPI001C62D854|nr:NAD(P)-dependent oxidoreductase [Salinibacterium sp. M195]QYH35175.1 NAD(P)-dependent oxidoreductase [Salinibacterium sp. M195]
MARIGFLGLGTMGQGMVKNLVAAGHDVTAWNRGDRDDAVFETIGASRANSIADAVTGFDFVLYCLSDDAAVRDVVLSESGVVASVDASSIVIDLSTIDPNTSAEESAAYAAKGIRFLDAPVFGSKGEAANGGLWIVVGGDREVFDAAESVLSPISETVHYLGVSGNGSKMKLVGNLIVAAQLEALGEALTLAKKAGLDLRDVLGVFAVTDFKSPIFDGVGAAVIAGDYSPSFALKLMLKDARLVSAFAERLGAPIPATSATLGTIEKAVDAGWGEENASALIKVLAHEADADLRVA